MNRIGISLAFCMIAFFIPGTVYSEIPDRQKLENTLVVTRQHGFWPEGIEYEGIWEFDLQSREYKLLRHFFFSPSSQASAAMDWGYLESEGDLLISQAWPDDLWFDIFSMRMVNRIPIPDAEAAVGWALQGPTLGIQELAGTGLPVGRYGMARCVPNDLGDYQSACEDFQFPGFQGTVADAIDRFLLVDYLSRGIVLSSTSVTEFLAPYALPESQILSFDNDRKGFWRGSDRKVLFYPAQEGAILAPTIEINIAQLAGDLGDEWPGWSLGTLRYHPGNKNFLGLLRFITPRYSSYAGRVFFSISPEFDEFTVIEVGDTFENNGTPVWFGTIDNAPSTFEQIVPIVADTAGDNGTHWITDLWLYNPSEDPTTATITRLNSGIEKSIELFAHASVRLENVLSWLGGGLEGDGIEHDVLFIASAYHWGQQLKVVGRMWTRDNTTAGTFGHTVPAVPAPYGFSNHHGTTDNTVWLTQNESRIDLDLREPGRFRHNLGITNVLDQPIQLDLHWAWSEGLNGYFAPYKPDDLSLTLEVPARSMMIVRPEDLFPETAKGWPPRIALVSDSPALIWVSMIDNITGDATFVPYTNYTYITETPAAFPGLEDETLKRTGFVLPVVASQKGRNGSYWRTDLYGYEGHGLHHLADQVFAAFWPSTNAAPCSVVRGEFIAQRLQGDLAIPVDTWYQTLSTVGFVVPSWLDPYHLEYEWRSIFPDVVHLFDQCSAVNEISGGLEIATGSWFSGYSRTFTTRDDGGTYGAMLPLYPPNGWPVQHFAGLELNEQTRINLGFFNGDHYHAITYLVTLFAEDGARVADRIFVLESMASEQLAIQNFFGDVELSSGTYGLTVLPLDQEPEGEDPGFQGHSWAYVSVIDNLTNDPINFW